MPSAPPGSPPFPRPHHPSAPSHAVPHAPTSHASVVLHDVGTVDSTQTLARRILLSTPASCGFKHFDLLQPHALLARSQTGGVGRTGNPWASPAGGVWLTLMWPIVPSALPVARPRPTMQQTLHGLGLKVGMAVLDSVRAVLTRHGHDDEAARLKWPNDVLIHGKKAAGMICEVSSASSQDSRPPMLLIGVGINADFAACDLPLHLHETATTLRDTVGRPVDAATLVNDLLHRLSTALLTPGLPPTTLAAAYAALHGAGERRAVTLADGSRIEGVLTGLSPNGLAVLRLDDGARLTLASGIIETHPTP